MKFEHVTTGSDKQALIRIKGLSRPSTILHITDSHMNETDGREGLEVLAESVRLYNFDALEARTQFSKMLKYADDLAVDGVALTGDIINGATINNLEYLDDQLRKHSWPYLYTSGNHDWEFPGKLWGEETRKAQYSKFERFTGARSSYSSKEINGILLLAIDNSTYQVSEEQLLFAQQELSRGLPTLLFMHIPIYIPTLLGAVMRDWGSPIMMAAEGWDNKIMGEWQIEKASSSTLAYYNLLLENPFSNLVGLFCGHVHFAHRDKFGRGSCQYVTHPGFAGGYRVIRLLPWT